jgi:ligand-binding sensor domain-containing protein/serine phosphatase RsbU (regulator of sigma subunit)
MFLSVNNHIKAIIYFKGIMFFFFSVLAKPAIPQDYDFRNFNSEEGLAQSYVYSIIQDEKGYLWVGTGNGLSRYNGFTFKNYTTGDSLADNFITSGIGDGECIWFGHMNGRLSFYNGRKFRTVNLPQTSGSPITHFSKGPDGQIWVSTYADGLFKLGKEAGEVERHMFSDQTCIISFEFLNTEELLIGTNTGLLYCRIQNTGKIEIIRPVAEIPESKVTCIRKMRNGSGYYVATENEGIFQLTFINNRCKVSGIVTDPDSDFTGIQCIYEDNQANIWLGSFGKGLIKIAYSAQEEKTRIDYFNKVNLCATDNVKTIYEDHEGNIWCGNYGEGLTQITPKTFSIHAFDNPLYGNSIFSIYINQQNRWIGTENGLIKMDQLTGKIVKFYSKGSGLPKDTVTTIYAVDGKELWIGTGKNGVYRMETGNGKILKYPVGNGILENSITSITGKGEQVWIGTRKGLCRINTANNKIKWYSISNGGLPHNYINCLYIDRANRLWISTRSNTLAYIQGETVYKKPVSAVNGILTLGPITEDADSRMWIGTNGNGVLMIESDSITNFTIKEGLLTNYCYSLICDDQKNIWVGHKGGLSKIRTSDFLVKPIQHFKGNTDTYQFNPNGIAKDQRGMIWFGSDKGLISYDPSLEYPRFLPPVLGITSIEINDEERDFTDKIFLSPGHYKIRINYLGICLKEPTLVTYQYKLEGYEQWSEITHNTSITYNHLSEGKYVFILNASSGDGAVTENPLKIRIVIKQPVWMKWWFYFLGVLFLVIITISYIKRNEYRFQAEKKILEEKVLERTYEIQCQKNEIELQRDMIDRRNANITSSITYASHIQIAVLPPLEFFNNLLPDNFILSKPKDIVSGDFYWLAEKDYKIIFAVADCTGHGVPGAFMSLLGITLLNEIVNEEGITGSDAIVTKLRDRVIHSLRQSRTDIITSEGIDIALCVLDQHRKRIQYTGAMNDLVYIRDGKLEVVKADHLSVSVLFEDSGLFSKKEIDCKKGDVLYLFSDGYQDQFGGIHDKKYLSRRFYALLLEIHELPMKSQKEILEDKFHEWKKDKVQTDDITVIGIRF